MNIKDIMTEAHRNAKEKGFYDGAQPTFGERIALIHSEASEALEAYRDGEEDRISETGKPEGITSELADVVIRVCDLAEMLGLPLSEVIAKKMEYNRSRPYRHGGKKI